MRLRWEYLFNGEFLEIIRHSTWFQKTKIFIATLLFLASLHLFTTELADAVRTGHADMPVLGASLAAAILLLLLLQHFAKGLLKGMAYVNREPRKECRALILFLSHSRDNLGSKTFTEGYKHLDGASVDDFLKHYESSSWRQPLHAIHLHLTELSNERLQFVMVIPSMADPEYEQRLIEAYNTHGIVPGVPNDKSKLAAADPELARKISLLRGSAEFVYHFGKTVELLASKLGKRLEVYSGSTLSPHWQKGVHFEDADGLVRILQDAFHHLIHEKNCKPADILIDITGGTALCSAIGAVVSLDESQRFQYVSAITGKVIPYDVDYVPYHRP